jgi:peptidoglycan/xylan/chitin deacetylase (PgdA/CDA1 family)
MRARASRIVWNLIGATGAYSVALKVPDKYHLRILTYHGVCLDHYHTAAWLPASFVTLSSFDAQMKFLAEHMNPVRLSEAVAAYRAGAALPPRAVAVTLDDGYENNFTLARPVLEKHKVPATIFLSTKWMSEGELFPHDRVRLIRWWTREEGGAWSRGIPDHKTSPIGNLLEWLSRAWPAVQNGLTGDQEAVLRPASWDTIARLRSDWIDLGAHTHHHTILGNENRGVRREEIFSSVEAVRQKGSSRHILFSYPNGEATDFDEEDKRIVREAGCEGAVATTPGWNTRNADLYALNRFAIGLRHNRGSFLAEITGFRRAFRNCARRFMGD